MRKPTNDARGNISVALWSGFIALWRASVRRPAWPLLLATLLFVATPFAASASCSSEIGGHSHQASQAHEHSAESVGSEHHDHDGAPQVAATHGAAVQVAATCCSCSSDSMNATVATLSAPHNPHADHAAVIYAVATALPTYRSDSLRGLNTRAGPLTTGKSQLLSLASLVGPAPPVSL